MPNQNAIFVIVQQPSIIAVGLRTFDPAYTRMPIFIPQTASAADAAVRNRDAIAIVRLARGNGPQRAIRMACHGAKVVICVGGDEREAELKGLAPANLIVRAETADQLARALHVAFGSVQN